MRKITLFLAFIWSLSITAQQYVDVPYVQDQAEKFFLTESQIGNTLLDVGSDRNNAIKILSSVGLLNAYDKKLTTDIQYRPVTDMKVAAMEVYEDQFVYLTDKTIFSNAWAGKFDVDHGVINPIIFSLGHNFMALVGSNDELSLIQDSKPIWKEQHTDLDPKSFLFDKKKNRFLILTETVIYELPISNPSLKAIYNGSHLTSLTIHKGDIVVGTKNGIFRLKGSAFEKNEVDQKLPWTEITAIKNINNQLWFGSTKGAFKLCDDGKYDYYASKRWLVDDHVLDIASGPENSILIVTKEGLAQIKFTRMSLAEKADYFQKIQRLRHIRYGFTAKLSLETPGDITSGFYNDTDNDGLWTSMYLASELFRYAVTKDEDAKKNAYEAFEAMERLTDITPMHGFPARSLERDGYEVGLHANGFSEDWYKKYVAENGRIWRLSEDGKWRWKSTTSSDESCGHFFAYALFAELAPDKEWRERAIRQIKVQMDHIVNNNWYLVDWNGKPTAWGRWNPKYVNSFPINVGDRRLNSTLILSFLQTAYHFTQDEKYKKAAKKLIKRYGYDTNANRPATVIGFEEGEDLSDKWNHSDDQMYFLTMPSFVNYSFSEEQKEKHFEAVKSHWEVERSEKNPIWNYLFAYAGAKKIDVAESAWWLREFPMDLIDWKVVNSHRKDLSKIDSNFRSQTYTEVLPNDERPLHSHNGAYRNNGGGGGRVEHAPYIYLLPYWAGRYVEAISEPQSK